ncbi:hypothetical protein [Streptomyces flavofungini]|uniref:hypothetical protein n=1 Tax=Streptomyces flavofungini TaxID=68200 RepID=UPI0025B044A3|nr:hypothetical protein [Streptomyces flavofungini]WJV47645.1 hypothetical protein QUY26_20225 [Streptomyces flavofungini]
MPRRQHGRWAHTDKPRRGSGASTLGRKRRLMEERLRARAELRATQLLARSA